MKYFTLDLQMHLCERANGQIVYQTSVFNLQPRVFWSQFPLPMCSSTVIDPFNVLWQAASITASLRLPAKAGMCRNFYFVRKADLSTFFLLVRISRCDAAAQRAKTEWNSSNITRVILQHSCSQRKLFVNITRYIRECFTVKFQTFNNMYII